MHCGVTLFPTDYSIAPADLARAAEQRGFESLWFPDHSHIPVHRSSPWPGGPELPKMYYDMMDPFVALSAAAAATATLKIGTGICLVIQRDPIYLAREVASLDRISKGRFLFGVGAGWNAEEIANHGTDFARRFKVLRERVEAMKAIWSDSEAEYHGEFVDFDPIFAWPKPLQEPHPPVHVGGVFPGAARRAIRYGNGWVPIPGRGRDDYAALVPEFRRMAQREGRDPDSLEVSVFGCPPRKDDLLQLRDAGVTRAILFLPPEGRDQVLLLLDRYAELQTAAR